MKSLFSSLLVKVISYLTSAEFVAFVKELVLSYLNDDKKTGEEKRKAVIEQIKDSSFVVGTNLMNLAIEGILAYVKAKYGTPGSKK